MPFVGSGMGSVQPLNELKRPRGRIEPLREPLRIHDGGLAMMDVGERSRGSSRENREGLDRFASRFPALPDPGERDGRPGGEGQIVRLWSPGGTLPFEPAVGGDEAAPRAERVRECALLVNRLGARVDERRPRSRIPPPRGNQAPAEFRDAPAAAVTGAADGEILRRERRCSGARAQARAEPPSHRTGRRPPAASTSG